MVAPSVRIRDLRHAYGKTSAVDDVTLDIAPGQVVGVIGPDGVGKSTLLGLIAGARRIQSGAMEVFDGPMTDVEHRRTMSPRIAYMPQGLGKNLYMTLFDPREPGVLRPPVRPGPGGARRAHHRSHRKHRTSPLHRSPRRQALRRHEAETRPLLRPDPRS